MTYLPFEKYIIERGFIPSESNEEFNVLTCPRHYFTKDGLSLTIDFRTKFFNPADLWEYKEVQYTVNYKGTSYIMPTNYQELTQLFKGELRPLWEVLFPESFTSYQPTNASQEHETLKK